MAFLEWRKFYFFELKHNVDDGKIIELFKDNTIKIATSGNNQLVIGDTTGSIYLISKSWHVRTFRCYELELDLAQHLTNSPLLITVGRDEPGTNALLKVWDTSRTDKNGIPFCTRITRLNRQTAPTTLCVHDSLQLMAIGFTDGSLLLYRGDITRERSSKQKLLRDSNAMITGLAFKTTAITTYLFCSTETSVIVYNITQKDREQKFLLDNIGCKKKCCILAESFQENHFMVARNDAIYCYTTDGRGPCYAVDGEKLILHWFRTYLIIITKNTQAHGGNLLTILDIHNKFIVYSAILPEIRAVLNEWGACYLMDTSNHLYHLDEKDLQSKLSLLFKKNLYDVAIRIARSQQYDTDGLVDIFKQYGDHLCEKGDYMGAVEQYVKTIGKLEPSYVIRKFLDSQHIEKLTMYLQALHRQGHATEDHTTLLLNCYTKLNNTLGQSDSLKEFVMMKDGDMNYDVEIAIKICRQNSPAEALMLARKHDKHEWYIRLQLEDHQRYRDVLVYIGSLRFDLAEFFMKKYGGILLAKAPEETTELLKRLCTDYRMSLDDGDSTPMNIENYEMQQRADPDDFIHFFLNNSERLVEFLEYLINENIVLTTTVYDTLLEHYLHVWKKLDNIPDKSKCSQKILKLLQNFDVKYDKSQALVVCHMHQFSEGILYLYEEQKLYQQILRYHITKNDPNAILTCCRRFGHQEPTLWVQALWSCIRDTKNPSKDLLNEILNVIAKERLMSPQLVIDALATHTSDITLGHIRNYVTNEFENERKRTLEITELTGNYRKDTERLRAQVDALKNGTTVIQGSRCAACHHPLELPTIHFLCQHGYHQHCFQSFCEEENECPACQPENKNLLELLKARDHNRDLHETFHSQLEKARDGFTVAAEYFGRGVFNRYKIITDPIVEANRPPIETDRGRGGDETKNYGPGAEARLRLEENVRSKLRGVPLSEGRTRLQERTDGVVHETHKRKDSHHRPQPPKIGANPFDEDEYDESKNPFAENSNGDDDKNPFRDDCDKNLNPFD